LSLAFGLEPSVSVLPLLALLLAQCKTVLHTTAKKQVSLVFGPVRVAIAVVQTAIPSVFEKNAFNMLAVRIMNDAFGPPI